jgi:hypothetical protein
MAGGTAVATHAAPPAANPTVDAKATDATMANVKPKVDAAALLAGGAGGDSKLHVLLVEHHRRPFLRDIFWKRVFQRNG